MKKIILSIACVIGGLLTANANSLTVINTTGCYILVSTQGGYIYLAPLGMPNSSQSFPSPNAILNPSGGNLGDFTSAKVINDAVNSVTGPWTGIQLNVGTVAPLTPFATSPTGIPCNNGNPYSASWIVGSTGDITLVIV